MKIKHKFPKIPLQNYRAALIFLIGMAAMAFVSRAADSFMVPRVAAASPEEMRLTYPLEIEGRVTAKESRAIYCMENLRVAHVEAHPNDIVEKGDLLFSVDREDLEEKIRQAETELKKLDMQTRDLEQAKQVQASQRSLALSRAKEDYSDISNSSDAAVDAARRELEQARDALALHDSQKPEETVILENTGANNAAGEPNATQASRLETSGANYGKNPKEAEPSQDANTDSQKPNQPGTTQNPETNPLPEENPQTAWLQKREEFAQACLEKEKQYEEAVAARNESLKTAARQLEDASLPAAADSSAALLEFERENSARTLQELKALRQAGGKVYAEYNGQVLECGISIGNVTSGEPTFLLADFSQPLQFEGTLEGASELPIAEGATGALRIDGQTEVLENVEITSISQESDGLCQVTAALGPYEVSKPGNAVLDVSWESKRYPCCLPISALYSGETGDFVIRVAEKPTVLGLQATAEYVPVTVLETNGTYAAVEGSLSADDCIVVNASKTIKEGDRIRISEN